MGVALIGHLRYGIAMQHGSTRRILMIGGLTVAAGALGWVGMGGQTGLYAALTPDVAGGVLPADAAHRQVAADEMILVDIRRPEEWRATGSPEGAVQLDMRRADFTDRLREIQATAPDRPIALICARGVRSARLANQLTAAGLTGILDVSEGMLGSAAGPGWIARGLPIYGRG
ncbi:MAG: rhodanese-like domain-containing protein [Rhodobacteraceae bacterium]|nr:rhodanese-like domain-containing protein [Paracoccaceae bacterium]